MRSMANMLLYTASDCCVALGLELEATGMQAGYSSHTSADALNR